MPSFIIQENRAAVERRAFTIKEFADAYRVSRATVYNMWRSGGGPVRMRVRGRVLISRDAAEQWCHQAEAQSGAKS